VARRRRATGGSETRPYVADRNVCPTITERNAAAITSQKGSVKRELRAYCRTEDG